MKKSSFAILLLISLNSYAQNVGIGIANPAEKLDVNGNINVAGTIKANGVDGTANQVLMKNNTGVMEWGDMFEYKKFLSYYSNGSFTVPAGTTKIMVELWGAGGGGNFYCGGGGGGYVKAQINVNPGEICSIQVGVGGSGANNATAADGGETSIVFSSSSYIATGGKGATYASSSRFNPGAGGAAAYSAAARSYVVVPGTTGGMHTRRYEQSSATTFYEMTAGGNGGATHKYPDVGGTAAQAIYNVTTSLPLITSAASLEGKVPGGGGASGLVSSGATILAGAGAKGMAIVYY